MENNFDLIEKNDLSANAFGGTELMLSRLYDGKVPRELLEQFQIIPTRIRDLKEDKFRILWLHDLSEDPETHHLGEDGYKKFHKLVFVSNWQMQRFIDRFQIPWSHCVVMPNAIEPIQGGLSLHSKPCDKIRLVYHTTPHRGMNILLSIFDHFHEKYPNVHLDLFSSYKIYGWEQRDAEYKDLFEFADKHEGITNHGAVPHADVIEHLKTKAHIFAYPSVWPETSCLCLIEAMAAGLMCVHPNFGALYETANMWTSMYQFHEDLGEHAKIFAVYLESAINMLYDETTERRCQSQMTCANAFFNWQVRAKQWENLLSSIVSANPEKAVPPDQYVYKY